MSKKEADFIIADAGGSGTQWKIVHDDTAKSLATTGFNPFTHDIEAFKTDSKEVLSDYLGSTIPVHFYAAGIQNAKQKSDVAKQLSEFFHDSIYVENDLLAVARSMCGRSTGNVCILGTGANATYYDGETNIDVSASLGFILGDEGSGAYLGKKLLQAIYRKRLSKDIIDAFHDRYSESLDSILTKLHRGSKPNQYLASFAKFLNQLQTDPSIAQLIKEAFIDFYDAFFGDRKLNSNSFHFSGSIAWNFASILRKVWEEKGLKIEQIVQSPMEGLVAYHKQYG
ncbi:MAG: hypothetical protein AAF616_01820 [Bacteroidota bacterium]